MVLILSGCGNLVHDVQMERGETQAEYSVDRTREAAVSFIQDVVDQSVSFAFKLSFGNGQVSRVCLVEQLSAGTGLEKEIVEAYVENITNNIFFIAAENISEIDAFVVVGLAVEEGYKCYEVGTDGVTSEYLEYRGMDCEFVKGDRSLKCNRYAFV